MVEFFAASAWCQIDFYAKQALIVVRREDKFWRDEEFLALGFLNVMHPDHGTITIVPKYHPWRIK